MDVLSNAEFNLGNNTVIPSLGVACDETQVAITMLIQIKAASEEQTKRLIILLQ